MNFLKKIFGKKETENRIPQNLEENNFNKNDDEESYGIEKENSHQRAIELVPEDFFWSCVDELAPFGSDEGDTALSEFRDWRKRNPNVETYECLKWTIEGVSEQNISKYNEKILDRIEIEEKIADDDFDDQQYIFTVDISVIATGFGQLVDEGKIDLKSKPIIQLAIDRQKIWAELSTEWEHRKEYMENLNVLERVLNEA
ncbi:hypothetical protein AAIP53_002448 [Flavobacterium psychrophilum]